jgi:hypothetical protein
MFCKFLLFLLLTTKCRPSRYRTVFHRLKVCCITLMLKALMCYHPPATDGNAVEPSLHCSTPISSAFKPFYEFMYGLKVLCPQRDSNPRPFGS